MAREIMHNPYSYESQAILSKIRDIQGELARAEELLRQGRFGATNELLDADFHHFCEYIRTRAYRDVPDVPQEPDSAFNQFIEDMFAYEQILQRTRKMKNAR